MSPGHNFNYCLKIIHLYACLYVESMISRHRHYPILLFFVWQTVNTKFMSPQIKEWKDGCLVYSAYRISYLDRAPKHSKHVLSKTIRPWNSDGLCKWCGDWSSRKAAIDVLSVKCRRSASVLAVWRAHNTKNSGMEGPPICALHIEQSLWGIYHLMRSHCDCLCLHVNLSLKLPLSPKCVVQDKVLLQIQFFKA